jgi:hypothetical protein
VERRINETEAAVIRQIFDLSIHGYGVKAITKRLNAEGAVPQAQRGAGRSRGRRLGPWRFYRDPVAVSPESTRSAINGAFTNRRHGP